MISIRECNSNIESIKDEHVSFTGERVKRVIDFYLEIFILFSRIEKNKRLTNASINQIVHEICKKSNILDFLFA